MSLIEHLVISLSLIVLATTATPVRDAIATEPGLRACASNVHKV